MQWYDTRSLELCRQGPAMGYPGNKSKSRHLPSAWAARCFAVSISFFFSSALAVIIVSAISFSSPKVFKGNVCGAFECRYAQAELYSSAIDLLGGLVACRSLLWAAANIECRYSSGVLKLAADSIEEMLVRGVAIAGTVFKGDTADVEVEAEARRFGPNGLRFTGVVVWLDCNA